MMGFSACLLTLFETSVISSDLFAFCVSYAFCALATFHSQNSSLVDVVSARVPELAAVDHAEILAKVISYVVMASGDRQVIVSVDVASEEVASVDFSLAMDCACSVGVYLEKAICYAVMANGG